MSACSFVTIKSPPCNDDGTKADGVDCCSETMGLSLPGHGVLCSLTTKGLRVSIGEGVFEDSGGAEYACVNSG